jgi:hypothetical protein
MLESCSTNLNGFTSSNRVFSSLERLPRPGTRYGSQGERWAGQDAFWEVDASL